MNETTFESPKQIVQNICDCGCSKLVVPKHLKSENLVVSFYPRRNQQHVWFTIRFEDKPDDHGWT